MKVLRTLSLLMVLGAASLPASTVLCPTATLGDSQYLSAGGGCNVVITFASDGSVSTATTNPYPYDGSEDTLVGVINNSMGVVMNIDLSSTSPIFGFDGDGICNGYGVSPCNSGTTGYEGGPGVGFSNIASNKKTGTVNFSSGIASGGTNWFSLEEPPSVNISVTGSNGNSNVPEPGSMLLLSSGLGLLFVGSLRRKQVRR